MNKETNTVYFLQKILVDEPNENFAEVWNQLVVCPSDIDVSEANEFLDINKLNDTLRETKRIRLDLAVCMQNEGETEREFLNRAEDEGYKPDFVIYMKRDKNWNYSAIKIDVLF